MPQPVAVSELAANALLPSLLLRGPRVQLYWCTLNTLPSTHLPACLHGETFNVNDVIDLIHLLP